MVTVGVMVDLNRIDVVELKLCLGSGIGLIGSLTYPKLPPPYA